MAEHSHNYESDHEQFRREAKYALSVWSNRHQMRAPYNSSVSKTPIAGSDPSQSQTVPDSCRSSVYATHHYVEELLSLCPANVVVHA